MAHHRSIIWTGPARRGLEQALDYVGERNPTAADRMLQHTERQISLLSSTPLIGRKGRRKDVRELVIQRTPFLVFYQVSDTTVSIIAFHHQSQNWMV
ncbi:MAG: type II toxin-antitoxin system RelE/ParE family toxin [Pikeienuella sp.]